MEICHSPLDPHQNDPYRLSFSEKCKRFPKTIDSSVYHELATILRPTMTIDFEKEIYAILPFEHNGLIHSLVFYQNYCSLLPQPPFPIIKQILRHYHFYEYSIFKNALFHLLEETKLKRQYKIPCAISEYSLLPLTNPTKKDTVWLNPGKIMELSPAESGPQLFIKMHNHLRIPSSVESRRLKQTMLVSFLAHGIIKREHNYRVPNANVSLIEYLELSFSPITNRLLQSFHFQDLPGKRGEFSLIYKDLYAEETHH
jgi:hypothetical protein